MIEVVGDLWTYPADWRVITTNGAVRRDGCAVMGRGCAKQATQKYPALQGLLGSQLKLRGNHVTEFSLWNLLTFPVKHSWEQDADLVLIARSARELRGWLEDHDQPLVVLPRPGCGNGRLDWEVVKPLLLSLPDNVAVIDFAR
jgi:hypothetical protein